MSVGIKLTGSKEIAENMRKFAKAEVNCLVRGVKKAVLFVEGEAVQLAPIEFGPLRGSAFAQSEKRNGGVIGRVGFTAKYAAAVHEKPMKHKGRVRPGRKGVYWQGGENKFLSKALNRNTSAIMKIIQREAKF